MVCRQHRASNQTIKLAFECFILSRFISLYCIDKYSLSHCEIGREKKTHEKDIGRPIFHKLLHVIYIGFYGSIVCPTPTVSKNRKWLVNAVTWSKYVWQAKIRGFTYAENHMLDLTREGQAIH